MAVAEAPAERTAGRPAQTGTAIRAKGLTKKYGDFTAVDKLDLTVNHGEIYGLLGPNGAGKTTTILMLLGLSEPSGGTARVLDYDPALNPTAVKRKVGYLPDNVGFYSGMTGRQNLRYTARLNRIPKKEAEDRIDAMLSRVGLPDAGDKKVDTYSRGMRQRLGLADVLVKEPSIIILDEPTTAIDPAGVEEVLGWSASWPMKAPRSCSPVTCCTRCSRSATGSASSSVASSWQAAPRTSSPRRRARARSRSRSSQRRRSTRSQGCDPEGLRASQDRQPTCVTRTCSW